MFRTGFARTVLVLAALAAIAAPTFAAGLPACCKSACCPMKASVSKGCCKAPEAPKPDASKPHAAPATLISAVGPAAAVVLPATLPEIVGLRAARNDHRAVTPDDSPPDLLTKNRILLI